jgi:hypothetical protein
MNWFQIETQAYNRQQKCSHLKGQIGAGPRGPRIDYNVAMHTFPTGETKIWCLSNCGWNVWNRPGWSFKWAVGMRMFKNTTNTHTASQVMASQRPNAKDPWNHDVICFDNNPIRDTK